MSALTTPATTSHVPTRRAADACVNVFQSYPTHFESDLLKGEQTPQVLYLLPILLKKLTL